MHCFFKMSRHLFELQKLEREICWREKWTSKRNPPSSLLEKFWEEKQMSKHDRHQNVWWCSSNEEAAGEQLLMFEFSAGSYLISRDWSWALPGASIFEIRDCSYTSEPTTSAQPGTFENLLANFKHPMLWKYGGDCLSLIGKRVLKPFSACDIFKERGVERLAITCRPFF